MQLPKKCRDSQQTSKLWQKFLVFFIGPQGASRHSVIADLEKKFLFEFKPKITFINERNLAAKRGKKPGRVGYNHTLPIRVCAAQRGRDF